MSGRRAIIIAARRTAIGKLGGLHKGRSIEKLAAPLISAVLSDAGLDPQSIDEVIIGNAAGGGGNPARLIALAAGMPDAVPALTLDRQCASGLDAIVMAARQIEAGAAHAVIAGGAESPSTAPWRVAKPSNPHTQLPQFFAQAMFTPGSAGHPNMIEAAENVARQFGIGRERQDAFALESHRLAVNAHVQGQIAAEILPLGSAEADFFDEGPRAGVDPRILGIAAVPAFEKLRAQTGIEPADLNAIELNEAFAAQVLATIDLLGLHSSAINNLGGALAYGHPYGASGTILVVRLFTRLVRNNTGSASRRGVAMIAAAGGVGTAALFHSLAA
jgi:acetyl-CoA C-acetyltransferase